MEGMLYPISLVVIAILAYSFNRTNNTAIVIFLILIGAYIVYTQETGDSATNWKDNMVDSIDQSAGNFSEDRGNKGYDPSRSQEVLK